MPRAPCADPVRLLAGARKVVILDLQEIGVGATLGLAAIILVLGLAYWLIREQDDRLPGPSQEPSLT